MTTSNVADRVKAIMNPSNPHALRPGSQIDFMDEREWSDYFDRRYGEYGASVRRSAYDNDSWNHTPKYPGVTGNGSKVLGYTPQPTRRVYVEHKDGTLQSFIVPYDCTGWYDIAKQVYPTKQENANTEGLVIPIDRCEFSYGEPTFNACVYTATLDYLQARWGRKLDDSDRRWLARHPLATDSGIPQEYTITAIQQLVAPYGMRVSRVRIRAGALVLGDQNMQWAQALGCNPLALADRRTSNDQAATMLGVDSTLASQLWRLEFSDSPLPGSIIGERGWSNSTGVQVGAMGGHARYLAPRGVPSDWFVSIQLAPDTEVEYLAPPPEPEYVERKGTPTLSLSKTLDPNGELIAVKDGATWRPWQQIKSAATSVPAQVATQTPPASVVTTPVQPTEVSTMATFLCELCDQPYQEIDRCYDDTNIDVCVSCAVSAWRGVACPECHHEPRWHEIPYPMGCSADAFDYQCQHCKEEFSVPYESKERHLQDVLHFSYGAFGLFYDDPMDNPTADTPPTTWDDQIWD